MLPLQRQNAIIVTHGRKHLHNYSTTNITTELLQIIETIMEQLLILNIVNVIYL